MTKKPALGRVGFLFRISKGLLGDDVDLDVGENALVALHLGLILTALLDFGNGDVLLLSLDAGSLQGLGHLDGGHGAIKLAALAHLDLDLDRSRGDLGGAGLGLRDVAGLLMGALADGYLVLRKHLLFL